MKNRVVKFLGLVTIIFGALMAPVWPFFELVVVGKQGRKSTGKKWFELSHIRMNHPRHEYGEEYEAGKEWCAGQKMKDCYIRSVDGLRLHACYFPAENPERILLMSHGYRGSTFGNFAHTAQFLHEHQCSLLFIDQRCCGGSEGRYITFGAKEQYDVLKWAYYIGKLNPEGLPVYLYGQSMGAAAALMASGHRLPKEVRGIIADCAFCSMRRQMQDMAQNWFHLKWIDLLLLRLDLFCRIFAGFRMKDADTSMAMEVNRKPILFFHGMKDTYVDPRNSSYNYARCRAPKELVLVPEARHLCSPYVAPELYREKLLEFFEKYD